jgi:hypothetical protein
VVAAFGRYRPAGYTAKAARANLEAKLAHPDFRHDIDELAAQPPMTYDPDAAATLVREQLLSRL